MTVRSRILAAAVVAVAVVSAVGVGSYLLRRDRGPKPGEILASYREEATLPPCKVINPLPGAVFPSDITAPEFRWESAAGGADAWLVRVTATHCPLQVERVVREPRWIPSAGDWERIKRSSLADPVQFTVLAVRADKPGEILARGANHFRTSPDPVGAPIFYREVILPFADAVKDPSRIRWRFGSVSSAEQPRIVMEGLPVCGNCHSFSADGSTLAMDIDYANNKGSYVITPVSRDMTFTPADIISWSDFRKEDNQETFGLLSQISPDGRFVVSTVKDKSVFVATPDLTISQLFFPIKGILVVYRRDTKTFQALPGADNPEYVHSNPTWSPDGKFIVFARAKAYELKKASTTGRVLLTAEECEEFLKDRKPFKFELYRIPFNEGKGGEPEPLEGASRNEKSNYFPKFTPDGRWIVFCKAENYMLLQADSELWIIPSKGGVARRLECNTPRMNSWHSFSPNGRWMVFSSKANSAYTQLFLTHLDAEGNSTPPVLLSHFTSPDRAANIPEFVNTNATAIARIKERFLDDYSLARSGYTAENTGDIERAIADYQKALELNPKNANAHQRLGYLLYHAKQKKKEGMEHTLQALQINPKDGCASFDVGLILLDEGKPAEAIGCFQKALELLPGGFDRRYNAADMHLRLAEALLLTGHAERAARVLQRAAGLAPQNAAVWHGLAFALLSSGKLDESLAAYARSMSIDAGVDDPAYHDLLGVTYSRRGDFPRAVQAGSRALDLARKAGDGNLVIDLSGKLEKYRRNQPDIE